MASVAYNHATSTMFNETEFVGFALPFFVKALGLTEDEIKEKSTTPEGQSELQTLYGTKRKEAKSEGYKEAEGKAQKVLNKLAKDHFGVETGAKTLEETALAIKEGYQPEGTPAGNPAELTEKAVKQHPLYLTMEQAKKDADKALTDRNAEFETAVNDRVNGKVTTLSLQQQARNALSDLKAKIPTHTGQKDALMTTYEQQFEGIVPKTVGETTYYYDKEGTRLEDTFGTPLTWDALSRQMAEKVFELEGPERSSPGAKPAGTPAGAPGTPASLSPKTLDDLNKVLANTAIKLEDKTTAKNYYKANGTDLG